MDIARQTVTGAEPSLRLHRYGVRTLLLANVLGPEVRDNAVAPGLIDTPWTQDSSTPREGVVVQENQ